MTTCQIIRKPLCSQTFWVMVQKHINWHGFSTTKSSPRCWTSEAPVIAWKTSQRSKRTLDGSVFSHQKGTISSLSNPISNPINIFILPYPSLDLAIWIYLSKHPSVLCIAYKTSKDTPVVLSSPSLEVKWLLGAPLSSCNFETSRSKLHCCNQVEG